MGSKKRLNHIRISEVFKSIQGEGIYTGKPVLFIRTSGCNRTCEFCDTKYHKKGVILELKEIIKKIKKSKLKTICWTGGEPLVWLEEIQEIKKQLPKFSFIVETNGDLLNKDLRITFCHITCSPKDNNNIENILKYSNEIKIVTDLKNKGVALLKYATSVMPLTTNNIIKNKEITKNVWMYCFKNNKHFSARLQYLIFNNKKGK